MTTASQLSATSPVGFLMLQFFGVVNFGTFPADPTKFQPSTCGRHRLGRARQAVHRSGRTSGARYGWGTPTSAAGLVANISALLEVIGEPVALGAATSRRGAAHGQLGARGRHGAGDPVAVAIIARGDATAGSTPACRSFRFARPRPARRTPASRLNPFVHGYERMSFDLAPRSSSNSRSSPRSIRAWRCSSAREPPLLKSGLLGSRRRRGQRDRQSGRAL